MRVILPRLWPALFLLTALLPLCGGCVVSLTTAQYALADVEPLGWVTPDVRPAAWCRVLPDGAAEGPALVVPTAAVRFWPLPIVGPEPIGVRYVVLPLTAGFDPPEAVALPNVAGMTAGELAAWVAGLSDADRAALVDRAKLARRTLLARRQPPAEMKGTNWRPFLRGGFDPDAPPPPPTAADVVALGGRAFIVAFRDPQDVENRAFFDAASPVALMKTPAPRPPLTGEPSPVRYRAAVVLPRFFDTSGGDHAARVGTALLVSPLSLAGDAAVIGFALLPLAMVVGAIALAT